MSVTYSFLDVVAALVGPTGFVSLGSGAGAAEEGITVEPSTEINAMTVGADGQVMHSLHANKSGRVSIRLLKTSPTNAALQAQYDVQTSTSRLHGRNTLTIGNRVTGDVTTCQNVAFAKKPTLTYAKEGGMMMWDFHAGQIDTILGNLT